MVSWSVGMRASCLSGLANPKPPALTSKCAFRKLPQRESPRVSLSHKTPGPLDCKGWVRAFGTHTRPGGLGPRLLETQLAKNPSHGPSLGRRAPLPHPGHTPVQAPLGSSSLPLGSWRDSEGPVHHRVV